ncbi:MAG: dienelactone hydrolase [Alphaproteobacteria bacterium]|nr:dienelactone hydrolase [Alphaproteobacteria bacterium]
MPSADELLRTFSPPRPFVHGSTTHDIYQRGNGPPVILLHELPGMTPRCLDLAATIADAGFSVNLPLLFGAAGRSATIGNSLRLLCVRRDIELFAANRTSPIVAWLRALCREVHSRAGEPANGVGVIGMCLTGNFALSLIAEPSVFASVVCQPSLPVLTGRDALAMSPEDLSAAVAAAREKPKPVGLCMRYEKDWVSPQARFERIKKEFGDAFAFIEYPGNEHAVLTDHLVDDALTLTIAHLKARLG